MQAQWKSVGVQVNIQNYPSSVVFAQDFIGGGSNGKWDMLMYAWTADPSLEKGNLFASSHQQVFDAQRPQRTVLFGDVDEFEYRSGH